MLKNHPKCVARKVTITESLENGPTAQARTSHSIPLPCPCRHALADVHDGEEVFVGDKVAVRPDGETHVHIG